MENIKERIIEIARKLNIDCIGFTTVEPFEDIRFALEDRAKRGYLSGFEEEDMEKRIDPLKIWEGAKSIISIGISYNQKIPQMPQGKFHGKISKSAWGTDYHRVLREKMEELMGHVQREIIPVNYRIFVDTGPTIDRAIAHRAGLGSYGKNNFIIHPQLGSWIFIGNIFVNIEIEPDQPLEQINCRDCNLCIKACPAGALEGPNLFNAKKCISFLTQKKEILTEEERELIGKQIYGCDICQQVCPMNKKVQDSCHESFTPDPELAFPDLEKLLQITNREFRDKYKSTAAGWRGKKTLQRNALIALGNLKDERAISILEEYLKDSRWEMRLYGLWALTKMGERGKEIIRKWLPRENHPRVKEEIEKVLL